MTILRCSIERWTRATGGARFLGFMMRKGRYGGESEGTRKLGGARMASCHPRHRIRSPRTYNVVVDDPTPVSNWLPVLANAVGSKPPYRVPVWLGRLMIGDGGMS